MSPSQVLFNEYVTLSDETDIETSSIDESNVDPISKKDNTVIESINFDEYPNEMNMLPENLQQLVTEALQTITLESSSPTSTKPNLSSTSDDIV